MADVTDATFQTEVVNRSASVPVVVDLWAPWCGPCKSLGPILERVIGETQGMVELAKVNVDENPEIGAAFQVQSIPAVYAMKDGKVVDHFIGAQGEPQVVEFVQRLLDGSATLPVDDSAEPVAEAAIAEPAISEPTISEPTISEPTGAAPTPEPVTPEPALLSEDAAMAIELELGELLLAVKSDDEARERYLALLDQLGAADPRTNTYRRKLTTALF